MTLVSKSFSEIVTFSRSSNATRVGPTGVLEYAPHNLLLQSQTFQTTWTSDANRGSITADAAAAPDGTVTADKLLAGSDNFAYRYQNLTIVNSTVYTASAYLKSAELTFGYLEVPGGGITYFNLSTGVISSLGSGATATITSVGNGWYRCSVTFTSNTTSGYVNLGAANASGSQAATNGSGIYLWGAQLAVGPYALDYTPTTSAAVYGPRFDYDGSGVTIVEPVSRNLLLYSQEFENAAWIASVTAVTANNAIAPDGTLTADTATIQNTGYLVQTYTAPSSLPYVLSVWMRAASSTTVKLGFQSPSDVTSCNVTTTWQRFTHTNVRNGLFYPQIYNDSGSAVTVELWGAQLEVGSTATGYMVSGATNGFRAVPVVSGSATPKGLLVEEQRTNLLTYSEDFSNAAWPKSFTTVTANAVTSPDGTITADKLVEAASTNNHYISQGKAATNGTAYTTSVFLKAAERRYAIVDMSDGSTGGVYVYVDLQTGTFSQAVIAGGSWTNASASIASFGNGWYRVSVTGTLGANNTATPLISVSNSATGGEVISYAGDGTSGIYIWGAQLEAGSFATSYIPTPTNSAVTRSADVASVNTLSPFYNATEGTIYAEWSMIGSKVGAGYPAIAQFDDTTSTNYIAIRQDGTGDSRRYGIVATSSTTAAMLAGTAESLSANTVLKSALAYKANDFAFVRGSTLGTSSSGAIPAVTNLKLGRNEAGTYTNAHVRRIAYYPRRLTNAELQALSA